MVTVWLFCCNFAFPNITLMADNTGSTLKEKTARGLFWGLLNSGAMQLLNLVIGIFLARLLTPADYGVVGMLAIFELVAGNLQDSGFGVALVNIKDIKHSDLNAVFWFNVGVSLLLYLVLFLCAPLIAAFFHQPCLTSLSRFLFVAFIFSALGIVPNAILSRRLMIKQRAIITVLALAISGTVAIVMAFNGFTYWSLATQHVLYNVVVCVGRYVCARWHPTLQFDFSPIRRMFGFSVKVLITAIMNTVSNNVLSVILGRLFAGQAQTVGNYTQANKWSSMAHWLVTGTVSQVAQPVLVQVQEGDENDRQRRVFRKLLRFTAFISFPALFGLALIAPQFITIAIGNKWVDSIPLLQILCISGAFMPFYTVYQNLFLSRGKSGIYMWLSLIQIVLVITAVLLCHPWGVKAMVMAFAAITVLWLLSWQVMARREIGLRFTHMLRDLLPFMLIAAAVMGVTYLLTMWIHSNWLLLLTRVLLAVALYFVIMKALHVKILDECLAFARQRLN